jgi:hypothetical protein
MAAGRHDLKDRAVDVSERLASRLAQRKGRVAAAARGSRFDRAPAAT